MHAIVRHNLRVANLRRHVDIITEMLVGQELHGTRDELPFVDCEGVFKQQAALVPVGARTVRGGRKKHVFGRPDEVDVEPARQSVHDRCVDKIGV